MAKPTVAAGFPKAFLDFAASRGADRPALIKRSHISPDDLKKPDNRVPLANYAELLQAGIELCDEPALALLFGEAVRIQDISIVGLMGDVIESLESVRGQVNRYSALMVDLDDGSTSDSIELIPEGSNVWLKFTSSIYRDYPAITQSAFARSVCGGRELFASRGISIDSFLTAIHFTHEEPSYRAEYDRIFGVPLFFGSRTNALLLDKEFLSIKLPRPNSYLSQILTDHAEELLKDLERSRSTRGRVEGLLIPVLHTGDASVEMIAGKLGLSRQTLFRKLKAEGVTFREVLDELRHRLALEYFNRKNVSVNQAAYLLGFSQPAAFSRAFKRWTGYSPRMRRTSKVDNGQEDLS